MPTFTVKEKTKKQESALADDILLQAVKKHRDLKANIKYLLSELEKVESILKEKAGAAPEQTIITPLYKITYKEENRAPYFNQKAAIAKLGLKTLQPFIEAKKSPVLRVS